MQLDTYLTFNGQCEAAFKFYEKCLGGNIEAMMSHGESPMAKQVSPEWRNKIIHARMTVGSTVLMGSDAPPDHYQAPQGFSLSVGVKDVAEGERSELRYGCRSIRHTVDGQLRAGWRGRG